MTAFQRPGVYVQETLNPVQPVVGPNSDSVAAFVGTSDRGPLGQSALVTSWSQFAQQYGPWNTYTNNDLPLAVYMYFANGGSQAYVLRVANGPAIAHQEFSDRAGSPAATLQVTAVNEGRWGNDISIAIQNSVTSGKFDLLIYYKGVTDSNLVEKYTDLTMTVTDTRYAIAVVNANTNWVNLTDLNSGNTGATRNPAVVSVLSGALAHGTVGGVVGTTDIGIALSNLDLIKQSLIINVTGYTEASVVNTAISYAEDRADCFVVIDGIDDTVQQQLDLAATYAPSSQAAVYYPRLTIADPTVALGAGTGRTKYIGAGGAVVGLYCATDAARGVFKAPAGLQTRVAGAVSVLPMTNADLDSMNTAAAPVNAIKYVPGSGIVVMGARTLMTGYVDKYVPVRRTLIYLRKALTDLTEFAIFEPNDEALWRRLEATINSFLTSFWSTGGLRGATPDQAFFVKVDEDNNPQYLIDNGEVHVEVGVALQRPAEFVVIRIGQFDGGATVTVA